MDGDALLHTGAAALHEATAGARSVEDLAAAAAAIRRLAGDAFDARADVLATTTAISALNDEVTAAVVRCTAARMDIDLAHGCWLAFGSQARGEQTIATDQDNGLVFAPPADAGAQAGVDRDRPHWMHFGRSVNEALAACGYPLCDGNVMAGQPLCCLSADEWCRRFEHWVEHGSGNDLFAARVYFDVRPIAGNAALAQPLLARVRSPAAALPRFIKQMADAVLAKRVPLNWRGAVLTHERDGRAMFDLKLGGTGLFVDAARLWALAHSIEAVSTVPRLLAAARVLHVPDVEARAWIDGFLALQGLRLRLQRDAAAADPALRCLVAWDALDAAQRAALKQALHAARWVQQRVELDYCR